MRKTTFFIIFPILILFFQSYANAQSEKENNLAPFYELINTLIVKDLDDENGVELVFVAHQLPLGGIWGKVMKRDIEILCKTWAKSTIDHAKAIAGLSEVSFIKIQVRSGGSVGVYVKYGFATDGKRCL